jgi:hypothetical protein
MDRVEAALLARIRGESDDYIRALGIVACGERDLQVARGNHESAARCNQIMCACLAIRDERRALDRDVESSFCTIIDLPGESDTD